MRAYDRVSDALAVIAGLLVLAVMLGVAADVAARFFFNRPFVWMLEAIQYALLAILFLGSPWVTRNNGHVAIDLLLDTFPPRPRSLAQASALLVAASTTGFLSWWAAVVTLDNFHRNVLTTGINPVPRHYLLALICIGLFLTSIEFLRLAARAARGELLRSSGSPPST